MKRQVRLFFGKLKIIGTTSSSGTSASSTNLLAKYGFAPMNFAKEGTATDVPKHKVFASTEDTNEINKVDETESSENRIHLFIP